MIRTEPTYTIQILGKEWIDSNWVDEESNIKTLGDAIDILNSEEMKELSKEYKLRIVRLEPNTVVVKEVDKIV